MELSSWWKVRTDSPKLSADFYLCSCLYIHVYTAIITTMITMTLTAMEEIRLGKEFSLNPLK